MPKRNKKLPDKFVSTLCEELGAKNVSADPDSKYLVEWRDRWHGHTPLLVTPTSKEQVALLVRLCARYKIAITTQGGNTGLVGGQIPQGEVLLGLQKMQKIQKLDRAAQCMTVEAGVTLQNCQNAANGENLLFGVSLASGGTASVGGAIATNAGGMGVLRYGSMRAQVLGLQAVLADGRIWNALSPLHKDNTGYDLKQLLIGSEGTLAIITAANLRLHPQPARNSVYWAGIKQVHDGLDVLLELQRSCPGALQKFELVSSAALQLVLQNIPDTRSPLPVEYPWHLLFEFGHDAPKEQQIEPELHKLVSQDLLQDIVMAGSGPQQVRLLALRENISAAQKGEGVAIKHDIALPLARIPEFLTTAGKALRKLIPGIRFCIFGHLGDGNLHYNLLQPKDMQATHFEARRDEASRMVHDLVDALGGSFSAEHGIGIAKIPEMHRYKPQLEMHFMRQIKKAMDPQGLLNPRVFGFNLDNPESSEQKR